MKVLVQRYSALGDIIILLPILQQLKLDYPELKIAFASKPLVAPFFNDLDIEFIPIDHKGKHKGLRGLRRFAKEIEEQFGPDIIIDAHMVLRSMVVSRSFQLSGRKVYSIRKDRPARKRFLKAAAEGREPLMQISRLHLENFQRAGFDLNFNRESIPIAPFSLDEEIKLWFEERKALQNIGIAPGSKHLSKTWPNEKYLEVMKGLKSKDRHFFLFGGWDEHDTLDKLGRESGCSYSVMAGKFSLDQESALCKELSVFISNDSSNMHLAAWSGCPVVSIWGGTHPDAGFAPYMNEAHMVALGDDELGCRPCSVFGTGECSRGDFACLHHLDSQSVLQKVNSIL